MAYVCGSCDFYDTEGAHRDACPTCGGRMRMTMLGPRATATATLEPEDMPREKKPEWHDPFVYGYEEVEAPWSFRYAQIGIGISAYYAVSRIGLAFILLPLTFAMSDVPAAKAHAILGAVSLAIYALAALVGGGVGGMWARNWVPQGLGVTVGVMTIPLVTMLLFKPENLPLLYVTMALTGALAVVGAYLGHKLIKPTRIVKS